MSWPTCLLTWAANPSSIHTTRHAQIVTKYQHNSMFPVGMSFLPDKSGRYLVADRNGKVWIGDPTQGTTLQVYMDFPDCFVKDEVSIANRPSSCPPSALLLRTCLHHP